MSYHIETKIVAAICLAAFLYIFLGGCTEYERNNYSPIPQNRPASWEYKPWGEMRN